MTGVSHMTSSLPKIDDDVVGGDGTGTQSLEPATPRVLTQKLNVWHLTGICYFAVSGGPFGFEEAIGSAGSRLVLLSLLVLPFLWSVPIALMTAELATLVQETGGHVKWVERGLGPTMGFANSMLCLLTSLTDNALYPVMFVDYLCRTVHRNNLPWITTWLIKIVLMVCCAAMNIRGVDVVGDATVYFGILVLAPFVVMSMMGFSSAPVGVPDTPAPIEWGKFLTVVMWNTSGFDAAGTCAAEVKDASTTYPKAVAMSLILVVATYVIPIFAALKVLPLSVDWSDGTWVRAAFLLGDNWLEIWMGIAAMLSSVGVLSTMLCATSRLFYGIATNGYLPPFCARLHSVYETPYVMICLNAVFSLLFTLMDFELLAQVRVLQTNCQIIDRSLCFRNDCLWAILASSVCVSTVKRPCALDCSCTNKMLSRMISLVYSVVTLSTVIITSTDTS